ncbi:hypothetical protein RHSIM_Rhsim02G0219900 [Rhododendron simsii]|uniref:Uncharacterized protein n=1 Tax=Rhododendron simsii TaxID=118357 RepID=A0A834HCG6_RHOSS|nr:hypothetical protein RHSIM_Rhsim02G0219900 [Rhododendron simsii]
MQLHNEVSKTKSLLSTDTWFSRSFPDHILVYNMLDTFTLIVSRNAEDTPLSHFADIPPSQAVSSTHLQAPLLVREKSPESGREAVSLA